MKNIFINLSSLFMLISLSVFGQITPWSYPGGNAPSSGDYLGTTNTQPLELKTTATGANAQNINFYTNNAQKMTILGNNGSSNGYVGIATASPSSVLHIDGNGTSTNKTIFIFFLFVPFLKTHSLPGCQSNCPFLKLAATSGF